MKLFLIGKNATSAFSLETLNQKSLLQKRCKQNVGGKRKKTQKKRKKRKFSAAAETQKKRKKRYLRFSPPPAACQQAPTVPWPNWPISPLAH